MAAEENSILRKVYFFKIEHFAEIKESLPGALSRIAGLPFDDDGRYRLDLASGTRLCAFPDSLTYPLKIRFGKTRRDALPQIEREGSLKVLDLRENEGLIDISHVMIFDDGFVAAEWNHEGPKLAQLSPYFFEKGRLNNPPKFLILMERDIVEVVTALTSVRILEIELPPDAAELAREADENFYTAIRAAEAMGATKKVALKLTSERNGQKLREIALKFADIIKRRPHERERIEGLSINGYGGDSRIGRFVDILESKLVSGEIFTRTSKRSRSIDTEDAYRVVQRAYLENRDKLRVAATSTDW
ncbi:hypothetical protein MZO42_16815 [Sphingomonas psychrotolerans]|uniref:Uncharacterized protein n=1 Tax=Sphingomonas psychrotolerans TaxID=1327635 RepID=A0ABU3N763_9SPHN|nr:hypothetical protein [Sphingomonas psychrotolerans]